MNLKLKGKNNMEWWEQPQKLKIWNNNVDYVMFIDENGNSGKINDILKNI